MFEHVVDNAVANAVADVGDVVDGLRIFEVLVEFSTQRQTISGCSRAHSA